MSETTNEYERQLPDESLNATVKIGLVAQGHIPTIERMLAEGKDWDSIGKEIGWQGSAAKQHFERYDYARLQSTVATLTAERDGLRKLFDAQVKELNGLYEQLSALRQQSIAWLPGGARGGVVVPAHIEWCLIVVAGDIIGAVWFDAEAPVPGFREESNDSALWLFDSVDKWVPLSDIPVPE